MFTYAVLGGGRQGTAAAYDMARWGSAAEVRVADADPSVAAAACARVNSLLGTEVANAVALDVRDRVRVRDFLEPVDAFLSAVPYVFNVEIARAAIDARAHMCDLGGHLGMARQQHEMGAAAQRAGISMVPNCGQVPGLGTTLMVYALEQLDEADHLLMWDGGIPKRPREPFNYLLTFNIAGLTNEYAEPAVFLREGRITEVATMTELETVEFPAPIGTLEAFVAGGGTDTMPWTYEGKLLTLQNKTLRHPGHFAQLRAFWDLGLWDREPLALGDATVRPRDVFHALFEPKVTFPDDNDRVIVRVLARGRKDGANADAWVELVDERDSETGFTAMERCTGWAAAIVVEMAARGEIPLGSAGVERQVPAAPYVEQLRLRGLEVKERIDARGA